MNENDFVYYKDENNKVTSGGFTIHSLALKNGLSPFFLKGGGGVNDTEFSQQFKDHIIPSFLHYQLAGDKENLHQRMNELLNIYEDHDNQTVDDSSSEKKGGDIIDLLNSVTHHYSKKNITKKRMEKKNKTKKNKTKK